jgi:hypothetical protein
LIFVLNETLICVLIHMESSSSGNMYQIILHESEVAVVYTYEHDMHSVKVSSVQHLWNICAHECMSEMEGAL